MYFFIGTEAELIKLFPVIIECQKKGNICHIIASGQNDLKKSRILDLISLEGAFIELSNEDDIDKNTIGLMKWFFLTYKKAPRTIKKYFSEYDLKNAYLIVHGDTISTVMGAMIGKKMHMNVCHVEAGLRSYNFFNPFPEEIDRWITSRLATIHFAPGKQPTENLQKMKRKVGKIVNTEYNTILDSLELSKSMELKNNIIKEVQDKEYFVFVMHRQENLMNNEFVKQVMEQIKCFSRKKKCVLILHKITENKLRDMGILQNLKKDSHFILAPRVDYFDFMKLLNNSQFVITDGGSNQEELYYMGKPCLIMRKATERQEGIGENAIMYSGKIDCMKEFELQYDKYRKTPFVGRYSPSKLISDELNK